MSNKQLLSKKMTDEWMIFSFLQYVKFFCHTVIEGQLIVDYSRLIHDMK